MVNWEDIHFYFFDEGYQRPWEEKGLTYQDAQEWIPIGFEPYSYDKVKNWKEKNFNPPTAQEWIQAGFSLSEAEKAKQWQNRDFTPDWIKAGLNSHELEFAIYLKQNSYQPDQLTANNLFELRKSFYPSYPQVQIYLETNYPCNCSERDWQNQIIHQETCPRNIQELNLRNLNLEGDLDLEGFPHHLKKIYLSGNPNLGEVKNKPNYIILVYLSPQEWLPNKEQTKEISVYKHNRFYIVEDEEIVLSEYPNLEDIEIDGKYLDMGKILQSGLTKLEVSACPKLIRLSCYRNNKLTSLTLNCPNLQEIDCGDNQLTQIKLSKEEKLETLSLFNNSFHQDLSFLQGAVNLEGLYLSNNKFYGSLEPLKEMSKLKSLNISDTDIDSGLEYLPESVKEFKCSVNLREDAKVKVLEEELRSHGEPNSCDFAHLFPVWKRANPDLIIARWKKEAEQAKEKNTELEEELTMEREEAEKALQKAQEWRERQLKELAEQKDKEIEELKKQVSQLQNQQQTQILQPTNLPPK